MARKHQANQDAVRAAVETEIAELVVVLANYPTGKRPHFGAPSRCPDCSDFGLVTSVDHTAGRCENQCPVCKRVWAITVRALNEHTRRARPTASAHQGTGALLRALAAAEPMRPPPPAVTNPPAAPVLFLRRVRRMMIRPA